MAVNATNSTEKEQRSQLTLGAFTFVREQTGRIVLHVDIDSGLYPLRLTHEQTSLFTEWLCAYETDQMA